VSIGHLLPYSNTFATCPTECCIDGNTYTSILHTLHTDVHTNTQTANSQRYVIATALLECHSYRHPRTLLS